MWRMHISTYDIWKELTNLVYPRRISAWRRRSSPSSILERSKNVFWISWHLWKRMASFGWKNTERPPPPHDTYQRSVGSWGPCAPLDTIPRRLPRHQSHLKKLWLMSSSRSLNATCCIATSSATKCTSIQVAMRWTSGTDDPPEVACKHTKSLIRCGAYKHIKSLIRFGAYKHIYITYKMWRIQAPIYHLQDVALLSTSNHL